MSYRPRTYRSTKTSFSAPATLSGDITDRQRDFAVRLMASINEAAANATPEGVQDAVSAIGGLTHLPTIVSDSWQTVSKADASTTIDALVRIERTLKAARPVEAEPQYPGLPALRQRVITTRFFGKCCQCGGPTKAHVDLAVQERGMWSAWCLTCATTDPAERLAQQAAERAARDAEDLRLNVLTGVAIGLARQAFAAMGMDTHKNPVLRFALPSATGNNDLDFFTVSVTSFRGVPNGVKVRRVIGGHADQPLALDQGVEALKRLTDGDIAAACRSYGQHLGYCCRCGRHLTDEASRLAGIGPDCATK